jgi:hypothetical protein
MLKTWTHINKEWFAEGSHPPKACWIELIRSGALSSKIICGTPYIEEDYFCSQLEIDKTPKVEILNLLD